MIVKITGLHIYLKRDMACLNLSRCLRPDSQISIAARIYEGGILNNDTCDCLSSFVGCCRRSVWRCMLRGADNIPRREVLGYSVLSHPVSLVEPHGQIVIFQKCCEKMFRVLMIYVRKDSSERHMVGFHGGFLCKNVCAYHRMYNCMVL